MNRQIMYCRETGSKKIVLWLSTQPPPALFSLRFDQSGLRVSPWRQSRAYQALLATSGPSGFCLGKCAERLVWQRQLCCTDVPSLTCDVRIKSFTFKLIKWICPIYFITTFQQVMGPGHFANKLHSLKYFVLW